MINENTIRTMCKLLVLYESNVIASELQNTLDVELLLDFVLAVCILSLYFDHANLLLPLATP